MTPQKGVSSYWLTLFHITPKHRAKDLLVARFKVKFLRITSK